MFRIPDFYKMPEMTIEAAQNVFAGDMLKGMEQIQSHWDRYATGNADDMYEDDDDFFDTWQYEVNAYNVIYTSMRPLFAEKV